MLDCLNSYRYRKAEYELCEVGGFEGTVAEERKAKELERHMEKPLGAPRPSHA